MEIRKDIAPVSREKCYPRPHDRQIKGIIAVRSPEQGPDGTARVIKHLGLVVPEGIGVPEYSRHGRYDEDDIDQLPQNKKEEEIYKHLLYGRQACLCRSSPSDALPYPPASDYRRCGERDEERRHRDDGERYAPDPDNEEVEGQKTRADGKGEYRLLALRKDFFTINQGISRRSGQEETQEKKYDSHRFLNTKAPGRNLKTSPSSVYVLPSTDRRSFPILTLSLS